MQQDGGEIVCLSKPVGALRGVMDTRHAGFRSLGIELLRRCALACGRQERFYLKEEPGITGLELFLLIR